MAALTEINKPSKWDNVPEANWPTQVFIDRKEVDDGDVAITFEDSTETMEVPKRALIMCKITHVLFSQQPELKQFLFGNKFSPATFKKILDWCITNVQRLDELITHNNKEEYIYETLHDGTPKGLHDDNREFFSKMGKEEWREFVEASNFVDCDALTVAIGMYYAERIKKLGDADKMRQAMGATNDHSIEEKKKITDENDFVDCN